MIAFHHVAKFQGKRYLFKDSNFQINPGDRVGLVGPNGAGKTTLFRLIVGEETADEGSITKPEKWTIGYFSQDPAADTEQTVLQAAMSGSKQIYDLGQRIEVLTEELGAPELDDKKMTRILEELGDAQTAFETLGGYDLETRASEILGGLGFKGTDLERMVGTYSGGWRMRIELAKVLLLNPDALLLDEPTNHLDLESIVWLEEFLLRFKGAIFMTSHDRDFMNRLVDKIVAVEMGVATLYAGNYDYYESETAQRLLNLEAAAKRQDAMLAKEERFIERFTAHAAKAAQVQSRMKMIDKVERIEIPKEGRSVKFSWPTCPRSGEQVVVINGVHKSYGDNHVLQGVGFDVRRQERVALLGVNGAGKSTLLKIIAAQLEADSGNCKLGANLHPAYFAQHQTEVLDTDATVFESVQAVAGHLGRAMIQNILGSVLFSGDDVDKKISVLSGGEKTRVVLARILANPVNFLILDEPTNHLDLRTREILLDALKNFEGTVVFISHDRHFLRDVATKVILLDKGRTTEYLGGLAHFLEKNGNRFPTTEHTLRVG
ncbi:MAG: ABC-F family ATP-binding cassette domain-containing protein [Candidatus Sericytochromatia bacterium]|nr:ABC-F family ATP-binding cassette domain-containing protein [Candidatus Sericytochromatia bacterium]